MNQKHKTAVLAFSVIVFSVIFTQLIEAGEAFKTFIVNVDLHDIRDEAKANIYVSLMDSSGRNIGGGGVNAPLVDGSYSGPVRVETSMQDYVPGTPLARRYGNSANPDRVSKIKVLLRIVIDNHLPGISYDADEIGARARRGTELITHLGEYRLSTLLNR